MLTDSEKQWIEQREAMQFLTGTYIADFEEYPLWNPGKDWQEAAEFEARVAAKLADAYWPPLVYTPVAPFEQLFMPPMDRLKWARLAVEEEMDDEHG